MPRPQKFRKIDRSFKPPTRLFSPHSQDEFEKIYVTREELEALKIRYYDRSEGGGRRNQTEAAKMMGISQTTYSRILNKAFEKVTKALVEGKAIAIQPVSGSIKEGVPPQQRIPSGAGRKRGRRGRGPTSAAGQNMGPPGRYWDQINKDLLETEIIFEGFGCIECGYQFVPENMKDLNMARDKPKCPNCSSNKTYHLKKKGPKPE